MRAGWFIVSSLLVALVACIVTLLGPTTYAAMKCKQEQPSGVFLAYCANPQFADYEHGAYYKQLEPEAIASLERADVIVLGSSIAQMSFSTEATASYFGSRKLRYHLLGFGYTEGGHFELAVLSKAPPRAKLYIIHAYGFFSDFISTAGKTAMQEESRVAFLRRKYGAKIAHMVCASLPAACGGAFGSIYRNLETGAWDWSYFPASGSQAIPPDVPVAPAPTPDMLAIADNMATTLRVPRECIVVTMTPNVGVDLSDQARRFAEHIHATALIPQVEGLTTVDGYHLDRVSSERWSAAFFAQLDKAASGCLALEPRDVPHAPTGVR